MRAALLARERRRADGVDPATMWTIVADPTRLESWAPVRAVTGAGSLLGSGNRFTATLVVWPWRGRCDVRVADYEAGRMFRLEFRTADDESVWLECRVESVVEPSGAVAELALQLEAPRRPRPARWLSSGLGRWRLRRAARTLVATAKRRT